MKAPKPSSELVQALRRQVEIEQQTVEGFLRQIVAEVSAIRADKYYHLDHLAELGLKVAMSLKRIDTLKETCLGLYALPEIDYEKFSDRAQDEAHPLTNRLIRATEVMVLSGDPDKGWVHTVLQTPAVVQVMSIIDTDWTWVKNDPEMLVTFLPVMLDEPHPELTRAMQLRLDGITYYTDYKKDYPDWKLVGDDPIEWGGARGQQ